MLQCQLYLCLFVRTNLGLPGQRLQVHAQGHLNNYMHCLGICPHSSTIPAAQCALISCHFQIWIFYLRAMYLETHHFTSSFKHLQIIFPLWNLEIDQQNSGFYLCVWNGQIALLKVISGKSVLSQDTELGFKSSFLSC